MKEVVGAVTKDMCKTHVHLLGAFLDGALDAAKTLEVDEHLSKCEVCRERVELDRAVRGSLKKTMTEVKASDDMRKRVLAAMLAAQRGEHVPERLTSTPEEKESQALVLAKKQAEAKKREVSKLASWRTLVPLASAAAIALAWTSVADTAPQASQQTDVMRAGFGHDPLADLVAQHSTRLPPERTDPKDVRGFEQVVGVPVHPLRFRQPNARFVGGRLTTIHREPAAMLQYEVPAGAGTETQRVTVFIYDPHKIRVGGAPGLSPRAVGSAEVSVGRTDGYTVAVRGGANSGVTVVTDDMDPEQSAQLAVFTDDE